MSRLDGGLSSYKLCVVVDWNRSEREWSLMFTGNGIGPRIEPWGTPGLTGYKEVA